jgi:hypothetical protein
MEAIADSKPKQSTFGAAVQQINRRSSQFFPAQNLTPLMIEVPTRMQAAVTESLHSRQLPDCDKGGLLFCRVGAFWLQGNEAG